jgi:hypothetical protein
LWVNSFMREWRNGRRARLRIWSRKGWRFKSSLAHQLKLSDFAFSELMQGRQSAWGDSAECEVVRSSAFRTELALPRLRNRALFHRCPRKNCSFPNALRCKTLEPYGSTRVFFPTGCPPKMELTFWRKTWKSKLRIRAGNAGARIFHATSLQTYSVRKVCKFGFV